MVAPNRQVFFIPAFFLDDLLIKGDFRYFPYHSLKFAHRRLVVPSPQFTFDALRAAIQREAVVFVTRGKASWEKAVPELVGYSRAFCTRSVQNVVISAKNCPRVTRRRS